MTCTSGGWDFDFLAWVEELLEVEPLVSSGVTMFTQPPGGQPCPVPEELLPDELEEPPEELLPDESHPMSASHAKARGVANKVSHPSRNTATPSIRATFMAPPRARPRCGSLDGGVRNIERRTASTMVLSIKAKQIRYGRAAHTGLGPSHRVVQKAEASRTSMLWNTGSPSQSLLSWPANSLVAG